jgi:histidyl-tRNA synthetase
MDRNVFRILDCKKAMCKKVVSGLGLENMSSLCPECSEHFNEVTGMLQEMRIAYQHQATLVRGLDYYTRTVFEFIHPELGSQDAFCAGGRYDHLIEALGGPSIPGVGFALGLERLLLLQTGITGSPCGLKVWVYVATLGDAAQRHGFKLLEQLRQYGIPSETDYLNRSLKAQMREASRLQAKEVIILGDNELARKTAVLRNMGLSSQQEVDFESLPNLVRSHYEQGV